MSTSRSETSSAMISCAFFSAAARAAATVISRALSVAVTGFLSVGRAARQRSTKKYRPTPMPTPTSASSR
ncbi:DUF6234 family protein [Salana multivorans]